MEKIGSFWLEIFGNFWIIFKCEKLKSLQNFYKVFVGFVERNMNKEWISCEWAMNEL